MEPVTLILSSGAVIFVICIAYIVITDPSFKAQMDAIKDAAEKASKEASKESAIKVLKEESKIEEPTPADIRTTMKRSVVILII
jgi:hypothetical protein